jgi:DNA-binding beta-propeller fold protein YncE
VSPTLTHVISADDECAVVGVTSVDDRLFVLRSPSRQHIQVYDLNALSFQQQTLKITSLSNQCYGLTACVINKCLYVTDYDNDTAYKVQLTVNKKKSRWPVGRGPRGLSINAACNLLVACYIDDRIQEYNSTNGSLLREVRFNSRARRLRPYHVMQLTSGKFLVGCCAGYSLLVTRL